MIVFVESNFALEVALRRSEAEAAEEILTMAESGQIMLAVPAFSLVEPFYALERFRRQRMRLHDELGTEIGQMTRSTDFAGLRAQSNALLAALATKADIDAAEFEKCKSRLAKCAVVLPLTAEIILAASNRQSIDLEPHDSLVFASVESFLVERKPASAIFANRDAKGFMTQSITNDLSKFNCAVIPSFMNASAFLKKRVQGQSGESI